LTAAPRSASIAGVPEPRRPLVVPPGEGRTIQGPAGGPLTFKARGEQTGGALTAIENVIAPGEGPPVHVHPHEDEFWWVIEGTLGFLIGDERSQAPAGTFVFVPRTVPHAFRNVGTGPARILVMFTPSGMERFFETFATLPGGAGAFATAGREADMTVVAPPLDS
jgi:quercetin dioxygenase-like cupin family protein